MQVLKIIIPLVVIKRIMDIFKYSEEELITRGGFRTATEINQQPSVWRETTDKFSQQFDSLSSFIRKSLEEVDCIIFTGAGTSSFIGYSLAGLSFKYLRKQSQAVATTEIVTFPEYYFNSDNSCLIVSFARSGNSPESKAALELADRYCKKCFHLIFTCDAEGDLAQYRSVNPVKIFVLPESTNDKSLAMTGSYSSMLLCGLVTILATKKIVPNLNSQLELAFELGEKFLANGIASVKSIADKPFKRAVFLGSGSLYGTASEGALKLQELTNGEIICKADTFMGFRHGPKAVIHEDTLVVYFFSNDEYVHRYEMDLLNDMSRGSKALFHLGVSQKPIQTDILDCQINFNDTETALAEELQLLNFIIPAQLLGFFKSLKLGLKPDTPSLNGAISRVVEGVHIYPVTEVS